MLHEDDFILRAVKRLAEFIARALGLAAAKKPWEARQILHDAAGSVLGLELSTLELVDAKSAVALLGDWKRVVAAADLLGALAHVEWRAGDAAKANRHFAQALSLLDVLDARNEITESRERLLALIAAVQLPHS